LAYATSALGPQASTPRALNTARVLSRSFGSFDIPIPKTHCKHCAATDQSICRLTPRYQICALESILVVHTCLQVLANLCNAGE
jgi:hypothetical protein